MKTLLLTAIISIAIISIFVIFLGIQSQYRQEQGVYQYEINEPYNLTDKYHETIKLQNKTFFVDDISKWLNTSNSTETEWYGIKFALPHGSNISTTPGGKIFESYVTFPNETVPYRLAIGKSSSPGAVNYDYTTVLSTHTYPQAGITLHNGTIALLVNWPKVYSDLAIIGLNETYKTGQPIDFQIEAKGFDYFNGGETPRVWVEREDGSLVWSPIDKINVVLCCPPELENYDRKFKLTDLGAPVTIDKPDSYKLIVSYNRQVLEKQFTITQNDTTNLNILSENGCGQFYTVPQDNYYNGSETYPVLILKQNSIGCARLTFTINYLYNDNRSGSVWSQMLNFTDMFHIGKYNYTSHGNSFGVSSIDTMQMFKTKSIPEVVDLSKYPVGSQFTIKLIIQPLSNATGFYDYSIEEMPCNSYPLVVGYSPDQVNSDDFSKGMIGMHNHSCFNAPYGISAVEVSGMDFKQVKFP